MKKPVVVLTTQKTVKTNSFLITSVAIYTGWAVW